LLQIDEFLSTGTIAALEELRGESGGPTGGAAPVSKEAELAMKFM
jgi:hypothetical protein